MIRKRICPFETILLAFAFAWTSPGAAAEPLLVVAHPDTPALDGRMVQRLFQGKVVQVDGKFLTPVNLPSGNATRELFIQRVVKQDDEQYIAYWTVRRYIGKGAPPRELSSEAELIDFVRRTPGAVGYVDGKGRDDPRGVRVLFVVSSVEQ